MPGPPIKFQRLSGARNFLQGGIERKPIHFARSRERRCGHRVHECATGALPTGRSGKTESGRSREARNDPQGVQAAREKSMGYRRPSTLHLWWATKPLAACRAMLLALLWPDPCDPHCPGEFKRKARQLLPSVQGMIGPSDHDLRKALLKLIGDFANGNLADSPKYLEVSRTLVDIAQGPEAPLVVDPFAGSGSIPLEALRLGCEVFASDLNPVACLILKVLLEDIPRHGLRLRENLRRVGGQVITQAETELAPFYPTDPDGSVPIAYLWARTVQCESPNCGCEIPLVSSFWLCNK